MYWPSKLLFVVEIILVAIIVGVLSFLGIVVFPAAILVGVVMMIWILPKYIKRYLKMGRW